MADYPPDNRFLTLEDSETQADALAEFLETMSERWERLEPVLAHLHAGIEECRLLMPCLAEQAAACHAQVEAVPNSKGAIPKCIQQTDEQCPDASLHSAYSVYDSYYEPVYCSLCRSRNLDPLVQMFTLQTFSTLTSKKCRNWLRRPA